MAISKAWALLAALALCGAAHAAPTQVFMPEGTYDLTVGMSAVRGRDTLYLPTAFVQWSNGSFLGVSARDGVELGWHASDNPEYEYGPMLEVHNSEQGDSGRNATRGAAGAFFNWNFDRTLSVFTRVVRGKDEGYLVAGVHSSVHLASHHDLSFNGGMVLTDGGVNKFIGADWSWQVAKKYFLISGLSANRDAGASGPGHWRGRVSLLYRF